MRIVADEKVATYIRERGGHVWVWLDPHRCVVGAYTYLEAHTEPPRSSRETSMSRSSRRPHRFEDVPSGDLIVHFDRAGFDPPESLHLELRGFRTKRVEAYWDGCIFVDAVHPLGMPRPAEA
jgi:hypothetical protein